MAEGGEGEEEIQFLRTSFNQCPEVACISTLCSEHQAIKGVWRAVCLPVWGTLATLCLHVYRQKALREYTK
ncbi:Ryanodine receptor 2, partial [Dissostichus eleginoides]